MDKGRLVVDWAERVHALGKLRGIVEAPVLVERRQRRHFRRRQREVEDREVLREAPCRISYALTAKREHARDQKRLRAVATLGDAAVGGWVVVVVVLVAGMVVGEGEMGRTRVGGLGNDGRARLQAPPQEHLHTTAYPMRSSPRSCSQRRPWVEACGDAATAETGRFGAKRTW
jgi:hypothetical protein